MKDNRNSTVGVLVADKRELPAIRARQRLQQRLREVQARKLERELIKCQEKKKI
jgi:hypothetical protein